MSNLYSISEVAQILGMPASTIRYYDNQGLLSGLSRSNGGARVFTDDDIERLWVVERLKASNMPLREIKRYLDLSAQGDASIEERRKIVHERKKEIEKQMDKLQVAHDFIVYKCWFYDTASEAGTCDVPREMSDDEMPPEMAEIKSRCMVNKF